MGARLFSNYYETVSILLFGIGFTALLLNQNLVKKIIGLNIAETAVYLFLAAKGYIAGGLAPILAGDAADAVYVNPLPAGLILTGIVISVSVTAFSLAIIISIYKRYDALDLDEIIRLAALEQRSP